MNRFALAALAASLPVSLALEAAPPTKGKTMEKIPGYTYGTAAVPRSPITPAELELMKKAVLFTADDEKALRMSKEVLADQTDAILDVWYGFVASHPHLVHFFGRKSDGQPDAAYLAAVRKRFAQWILDTAEARYDQTWLDYQDEIGRRHTRAAKNRTDGVASVDVVSYRYMPLFVYPITTTLKPFLAKKGHAPEDVERMHQAWVKSVLLQVALWSRPYVPEKDF